VPLHWRPVGPLPAETYWRRRAGVLLAILFAGVLVWLPLRAGDDDRLTAAPAPTSEPAPSDAADPTAEPTASPTPQQIAACPDDTLDVGAATDAEEYPPGATAVLTLTVRNTGDRPCRRPLGQDALELIVTSGSDRIWSSDDCAPGGPQDEVVLAPGEEFAARATWPLVRSAPGCPPDQPAALPGTYRLIARVGDLRAEGAVFRVAG
jgi:hypothetical protein